MSCCLVSCCYTLSPTVDVPRKAPQNIQIVLLKILENGSGQLPPCLRTKVVFDLCLNWTEQDAARRITPTIWRKHGKSRQDKKMFVCTNPEAVSPCLQNHFTQTPRVSRLLCVCACVCMCMRTRVRACVCVCAFSVYTLAQVHLCTCRCVRQCADPRIRGQHGKLFKLRSKQLHTGRHDDERVSVPTYMLRSHNEAQASFPCHSADQYSAGVPALIRATAPLGGGK